MFRNTFFPELGAKNRETYLGGTYFRSLLFVVLVTSLAFTLMFVTVNDVRNR